MFPFEYALGIEQNIALSFDRAKTPLSWKCRKKNKKHNLQKR